MHMHLSTELHCFSSTALLSRRTECDSYTSLDLLLSYFWLILFIEVDLLFIITVVLCFSIACCCIDMIDFEVAEKGAFTATSSGLINPSEFNNTFSALGASRQTQNTHDSHYFSDFAENQNSITSSTSLATEIYAIHNVLTVIQERIKSWQHSAEKEAEMAAPVFCWNGCGFKTKFEAMTAHVRENCPFKPSICGQCNEVFKAKDLHFHMTRNCQKRLMGCPNALLGCGELIKADYMTTHTTLRCPFRLAYCRLHCNSQVPVCKLDDHEKTHCKKRRIPCHQCEELVPSDSLAKHLKNDCQCRKIKCTKGCHEYFNLKDIEYHEEFICAQPCKWMCGEIVGPKEKRNLHEVMECDNRPVMCAKDCGISGLTARNKVDHENHYCKYIKVKCPHYCGAIIYRNQLTSHIEPWHGTCPQRLVRCPSNLIGWRIMVNMVEGIVIKYSRKEKSFITPLEDLDEIEDEDIIVPPPDGGDLSWCADGVDMLYVRFSTRHAWIPYWTSKIIPIAWQMKGIKKAGDSTSLNQGMYQCSWVQYSSLNDHLAHSCCNREVLVGAVNPKTEMTYGKMTVVNNKPGVSSNSTDPDIVEITGVDTLLNSMKNFDGQLASAKVVVPIAEKRHEINAFLTDQVTFVSCEFCSAEVKTEELAWHVKQDCTHILLRCKFGCGKKLMRRQLEIHMESECTKRFIKCSNCEEEMWADELDQHAQEECKYRPVECRYECGAEGLTAHSEIDHAENICEKRIYTCECGDKYPFFVRSDHLITVCPKRQGLCPQGCNQMISRDVLDDHMELSCPNKDVFQNKPVNCPMKCGMRMLRKEVLEHVTYKCIFRITECPFKCGNTFKNEKLGMHLHVCANRPIQCEKGMPTCDFPLCQWLYKGDGSSTRLAKPLLNDEPEEESMMIGDEGSLVTYNKETPAGEGSLVSKLTDDQSMSNGVYLGSGPIIPRPRPPTRGSGKFVFPDEKEKNRIKSKAAEDEEEVDYLAKADEENLSHAKSSTSCEVNNGKIEILDDLRLYSCPHHGRNLLMYAVRYDEIHLVKWIIQKTNGDDLDIQDRFGDTAMTLACRMQRVEIVDLLMHHGADVNMETYGGKTPLIEATKVNNRGIVEKLMSAGAIALYKTAKHRKTAIDWAKYLNFELLLIYLELGAVTQTQIETIFHGISRGDTAFVLNMIEPGEFFEPTNIGRFTETIDDTMESLEESREIISGHVDKLKVIAVTHESTKKEFNRLDEIEKVELARYEGFYNNCKVLRTKIGLRFERYDKDVFKLSTFDLEEIRQMKRPIPIVRLSVLSYCLLFGVFDTQKQLVFPTDEKGVRTWWSKATKSLAHPDTLGGIKNFPWAMLQSPHKRALGQEVKRLYLIYVAEKEHLVTVSRMQLKEANDVASGLKKNLMRGPKMDSSFNTHVPAGVVSKKKKKKKTVEGIDTETDHEEDGDEFCDDISTDSDDDGEIPQELWDSDAEDAGGGHWEKGEWVDDDIMQADWWDKDAVKMYKKKKKVVKGAVTTKEKKRATLVMVTSEEKEVVTQSIEVGTSSNVENVKKQEADDEHIKMPFVHCMELLMSAVAYMMDDMDTLVHANHALTEGKKVFDRIKKETDIGRQAYFTEAARQKMIEAEMIQEHKRSAKYKERIEKSRERLRVAMLLNKVTASGHTAISWAAAHGTYDIMEGLLSRGGTVGYNEELLHMSATIIQTSFRIFYYHSSFVKKRNERLKAENKARQEEHARVTGDGNASSNVDDEVVVVAPLSAAALLNKEEGETVKQTNSIEEFFQLRDFCGVLIFQVNRRRRQFRFPIPEAAYNGHSHIVDRIFFRKLAHFNFLGSWMMPCPPPPRPRSHKRLQLTGPKYTFPEVIDHGREAIGAGCWVERVGWVSAQDPRNMFFEEKDEMLESYHTMVKRADTFRGARLRVRLLNIEKKKLSLGKEKMTRAIVNGDFVKCIEFASTDVCSIDFETDKGLTALIVASEENIGGLHHTYVINTDGEPVLAVCYLLDRPEHAPGVNVENKFGVTALMHAASLGREHCVEALLDRFAEIDRVNRNGETALHIASKTGNTRCAKLLIERGASLTLKANNGMDAYSLALDEGFTDVLVMISQFRNNFLGPVKVARGTVDERHSCPIGCGIFLQKHEVPEHLEVCVYRPVACPYGCSDTTLLSRELDHHMAEECPARPHECPKCHEINPLDKFERHSQRYCSYRLLDCTLSCGERIPAREMSYHLANCSYKIMQCPEYCGQEYPMAKRLDHVRNHCPNRRVVCPLKCSALVVFRALEVHVTEVCPCRPEVCRWCGETKLRKDWTNHEKICDHRRVLCDASCGDMVVWKEMQNHIKNSCKNRFISCPLKCGYKARGVDMDVHLEKECDNRMMECPNKCMMNTGGVGESVLILPAKQCGIHMRVDCPERFLKCGMCQEGMLAKELPHHNKADCEFRTVDCRCLGCMKKLPCNQREDHEKHKCKFRLVICPAGCGLSIMFKKLERHMETKCDMLRVQCVSGCGQVVQQGQMGDHLSHECPRRVMRAMSPGKKKQSGVTSKSKPSTPSAGGIQTSFGFELDATYTREGDDDTGGLSLGSPARGGGGRWKGKSSSDLLKKASSSFGSLPPI
jgi:ankyrin repeat protein